MLATFVLFVSCSGSSGDASGTYTIEFPSDAALLSTVTIDVAAFDATGNASSCTDLAELVATQQALPTPLVSVANVDPCALQSGAGVLTLSSGERAILVQATSKDGPYLIGCLRFDAEPGFTATITTSLLSGATTPAPPACATFAARCQGAKC